MSVSAPPLQQLEYLGVLHPSPTLYIHYSLLCIARGVHDEDSKHPVPCVSWNVPGKAVVPRVLLGP